MGGSSSGGAGTGGSGTGATAGSTSGGSGPGGGGSGPGGGGAGVEDCLDGIDNDGDTLVDCADSDCTQVECVPDAPSGWQGNVRRRPSAYMGAVADCPDGTLPTVYAGGPASAACTACVCGGAMNASCGPPDVTCYQGDNSCNNNQLDIGVADGTCEKPAVSNDSTMSCEVTTASAVVVPGSCAPSGGTVIGDPWAGEQHVCLDPTAAAGGGCGPAEACVPVGVAPYDGPACILQAGNTPCPAAYPNGSVVFTGGTDTRGCSPCGCDVPATTCAGGAFRFYDFDGCAGGSIDVTGTCVSVSPLMDGGTWSMRAIDGTPSSPACATNGGVPSGAVTTTGPTTICCQ